MAFNAAMFLSLEDGIRYFQQAIRSSFPDATEMESNERLKGWMSNQQLIPDDDELRESVISFLGQELDCWMQKICVRQGLGDLASDIRARLSVFGSYRLGK